jgi:hypothetical protein
MFKSYNVHDTTADHAKFVAPGPAVYGSGGGSGSTIEESFSVISGNTTSSSGASEVESKAGPGSSGQPPIATSTSISSSVSKSNPSASVNVEGGNDGAGAGVIGGVTTASSNDKPAGSIRPTFSECLD